MKTLRVLLILIVLGLLAVRAEAFLLNDFNIAGYTGPFASVDIALEAGGTTADITVTGLGNYRLGGQAAIALNVNAPGFTNADFSSNVTLANNPFGSGQVSQWGIFNDTIKFFDGFTHSQNFFTFHITRTSGIWSSADDVLIANDLDHLAAAHIFIANSDGGNTGVTGYASDVPEPSVILLLGAGLAGLGLYRFRFRD